MEPSIRTKHLATYDSSSFILTPVLGEGREERWKLVNKIFDEQIVPLYQVNDHLLERVKEGSHKCRLLYADSKPLGLLIYNPRLHYKQELENCLEINVLHSLEEEKDNKPISTYLLDEIKKIAKEAHASAISIVLPNSQRDSLNFFKRHKFKIIASEIDEEKVLLRLVLEANRRQVREESPIRSYDHKRKRKELEEERSVRVVYSEKRDPKNSTSNRLPEYTSHEEDESFRRPAGYSYALNPTNDAKRRRQIPSSSQIPTYVSSRPEKVTSSTIQQKYLNLIADGRKTIEVRINSGMFGNLEKNGKIQFFNQNKKVLCRIEELNYYRSFEDLFESEDYKLCIPDATSKREALNAYSNINGYTERAARSGIVAIHLKLI